MLAADILPSLRSAASHELAFIASVPPLGYATYTISAERNLAQPEQDSAELSTLRSAHMTFTTLARTVPSAYARSVMLLLGCRQAHINEQHAAAQQLPVLPSVSHTRATRGR